MEEKEEMKAVIEEYGVEEILAQYMMNPHAEEIIKEYIDELKEELIHNSKLNSGKIIENPIHFQGGIIMKFIKSSSRKRVSEIVSLYVEDIGSGLFQVKKDRKRDNVLLMTTQEVVDFFNKEEKVAIERGDRLIINFECEDPSVEKLTVQFLSKSDFGL